jgi:hypothetical protein
VPFYAVPISFRVSAPNHEAAEHYVQHFAAALDHARARRGEPGKVDASLQGGAPGGPWVAEIVLTVDRPDTAHARRLAQELVSALHSGALELEALGEPAVTEDPQRPDALTLRALADAHGWLAHHGRDDLETMRHGRAPLEDTLILRDHLPAVFSHHYTPELIERWLDVVDLVAPKLAAYPDTYLASTAEELAAHAILREARRLLDLWREWEDFDVLESQLVRVRQKLDEIHDLAFENHAVLLLFDARNDGLEETGHANLHPRDWFKPFR